VQSLSAKQCPPYWQIKSAVTTEFVGNVESVVGPVDGSIERGVVVKNVGKLVFSVTVAVARDGDAVDEKKVAVFGVRESAPNGCEGFIVVGYTGKLGA